MIESLKSKELVVRWVFFIVLFIAFFYINIPFLITLIMAGIFALGIEDFITRLGTRLKMRRLPLVLWTVFAGLAIFIVPIFLAVYRVVATLTHPDSFASGPLIEQAHQLKNFAIRNLQVVSEWIGTDLATPARTMLESLLQKTGALFLGYSSNFVGELPALFLAILVFVVGTGVMLYRHTQIKSFVIDYSPLNASLTERIIAIAKKSCSVTLFSTFVIGLIQAGFIGFGSLVLGEGDFWLVITVTFFVSFIPVIGAAPVGFVLALLAFLGDRIGAGIGLVIIATLAGTIDNVLKPFMVSGEFKINAVIGFTCVVGAIVMIGLPGLLIGPVIMNLFVGISPLMLKNREPEMTDD